MHLTPTILEAAYNYLRATPPFSKWKLPDSDAVEFRINLRPKEFGEIFWQADGTPQISVSAVKCKTTKDLVETVAHEMVHYHQYIAAYRNSASHGPKFKALAAQVCKQHGFDPTTF